RRRSLALHSAERSDAAEDARRSELTQNILLIASAAFYIELQAHVSCGDGATDILHQPVMRFQNAVYLAADLIDTGPGNFVARGEKLDIKCLLDVTEGE